MSSPELDSQLEKWLPRLEVYRKAIDTVPIEVPINMASCQSSCLGTHCLESSASSVGCEAEPRYKIVDTVPIVETTLAKREIPVGKIDTHPLLFESETTVASRSSDENDSIEVETQSGPEIASTTFFVEKKPHIVHLPIDGILKKIRKAKSFVLGIGSVGALDSTSVRSVVTDLVARCCMKLDRKGILVSVRSSPVMLNSDSFRNAFVDEASWSYFGDTKADIKAWHAQLAKLPGWKQEFGLIVFDLGDIRFPMMPRIGKLCDGIVVQMLNPSKSRETIQAFKSLQKDRLKFLGAWSVELSKRNQAA